MTEETTNATRAGWARAALNEYIVETRHGSPDYDLVPDNGDNNHEVIGDFLCDLHHLCDELGLDWEALNSSGDMHYRDEVEEGRQAEAEERLLEAEERGEVKCTICHEPIHRAAISRMWIHRHGSPTCGTGDGSTAHPGSHEVDEILKLITPDPWGQAEQEANRG